MESKLVNVTIGYVDLVLPSDLAFKLVENSDNIYKFETYSKSPEEILQNITIQVSTLPSNFDELVAGAKAMGTSYNDYKNNSQ